MENSRRGPGRVPGKLDDAGCRSAVGSGIRLLTVSKRMAEAGTPTFFNSSVTAAAMACFLAGDAFDRQNLEQVFLGGLDVQGDRCAAHTPAFLPLRFVFIESFAFARSVGGPP